MELPIEMRSYITNDEKSSMAENATLLSELTRKEIELIAEHMHVCEADKGTAILKEGERGGYLCVLISGRLDVYKESGSGQSRKISTVRPGRAIGR